MSDLSVKSPRQTPGSRCFRAPGRVNIIGEHTDYNDGFVLPTSLSAYTTVCAVPQNDPAIAVHSAAFDESFSIRLDELHVLPSPAWGNYIIGVATELATSGIALRGVSLTIESDLPIGAGISSSAALEAATALALLATSDASMPMTEIAKLCQRAESRFAGVDCGIMDQYTVACCPAGHAMLLDCRTLATEFLRLPECIKLLVMHSGTSHELAADGYNERAVECRHVIEIIAKTNPGVSSLRDADLDMLVASKGELGDVLFRRGRHVVGEIDRTIAAAEALRSNDFAALGDLVRRSHESLRDDFEVSCPAVDQLVDTALSVDGVLGARMIGGGFGGCVLAIANADAAEQALEQIVTLRHRAGQTVPWATIARRAKPLQEILRDE